MQAQNMFSDPYGGYNVVIIKNHKQYSYKLSPIRRRGFTLARNIRRKRFTGYMNILSDGQTIIDGNTMTIYMTPETKAALDSKLSSGV